MRARFFVYAAILCAALLAAGTAQAQSGKAGNPYYDSNGEPYSEKYYPQKPGPLNIALTRAPGLDAKSFMVRISVTQPLTTCAKLGKIATSTDFMAAALNIKIEDYIVDMRDMPQHPEYECNRAGQQPYAEIVLNADMLKEKGTKQIKFKTSNGMEAYDIALTDHYAQLFPAKKQDPATMRLKAQQVAYSKNPLKYWFYPAGTYILYAPDSSKGVDLRQEMDDFAKGRGLQPLENVIEGFKSPLKLNNAYYYVDGNGGADRFEEGQKIGTVQTDIVVYGLEGDEMEHKNFAVYARKPGQYE